jgi:hypothetical protein
MWPFYLRKAQNSAFHNHWEHFRRFLRTGHGIQQINGNVGDESGEITGFSRLGQNFSMEFRPEECGWEKT